MKHDFPFDPTYGHTLETLLQVPALEGPADFADFWRDTYARARSVPTRLTSRPVKSFRDDLDCFEVEFDAFDNARIGGWVTVPKSGKVTRGFVVGHGYGNREAPDWKLPVEPAAAIFPCCRGLGRSHQLNLPRFNQDERPHVLLGIESRHTYIFRGCTADYWAAATALIEMFPSVADNLCYMGGSMGGGIGALAVPWEPRFRKAYLDIPSFANYPMRVMHPCVGSGMHVSAWWKDHPEVLTELAYHDASTAARHTTTPTLVSAALFDPAVVPMSQFAVYNGLAGPKKLFVREAAHFDWPGAADEQRRLDPVVSEWFAS